MFQNNPVDFSMGKSRADNLNSTRGKNIRKTGEIFRAIEFIVSSYL